MKLKAQTAIKPFETSVHINLAEAKSVEISLFHKLGSKRMIRDLEEGRSYLHKDDGSLLPNKSANDVKQEMIRLSTKYGVLCKHTAFVAVEEREEGKIKQKQKTKKIKKKYIKHRKQQKKKQIK